VRLVHWIVQQCLIERAGPAEYFLLCPCPAQETASRNNPVRKVQSQLCWHGRFQERRTVR
jgi:hypothetical protein